MEPSREEILKAMEQVIDPELKRNVVELDMVRDVRIEGCLLYTFSEPTRRRGISVGVVGV
jgi:metal-sulfur cluster biosynthetic enzyme